MSTLWISWEILAGMWATAMARMLVHGTLALLVALALTRWLVRRHPEAACWVWRLVFAKIAVLVLVEMSIELPLLAPAGTEPPAAEARIAFEEGGAAAGVAMRVLFSCWLVGVLACVLRVVSGWCAIRRRLLSAVPTSDRAILTLYAEACAGFGLPVAPRLAGCDMIESPVLTGLRRPTILIPSDLPMRASPADVRRMLRHELAHHTRHDLWWEWVRVVGSTLLFFHPLVWLAQREWLLAREASCDATAVRGRGGREPAEYCEMLLRLWRGIGGAHDRACAGTATAAGVVEGMTMGKRRLLALWGATTTSREGRRLALVVTLLAAGLLLPSWRLTRASPAVHERREQAIMSGASVAPADSQAHVSSSASSTPSDTGSSARISGPSRASGGGGSATVGPSNRSRAARRVN